MSTLLGWIGSICFATCGIPQVVQCWRQGHARGVSSGLLWLWLGGEVFYTWATLLEFGPVWWMLFNYLLNGICIFILLWYKWSDGDN